MLVIRDALKSDCSDIASIYNYYICNSVTTFEYEELSAADIQERTVSVQGSGHFWLVASVDEKLVGYAYSHKWRERPAYKYSAEVSIYIAQSYKGQGIGTQLYDALFERLKGSGVRVVIAGITLPNEASIKLHEKCNMFQVAHFKRVGFKFDKWLDVGYWQIILSA